MQRLGDIEFARLRYASLRNITGSDPPSLAEVISADGKAFTAEDNIRAYATAHLAVAFFLDGQNGVYREDFLGVVHQALDGKAINFGELARALREEPATLETQFLRFTVAF